MHLCYLVPQKSGMKYLARIIFVCLVLLGLTLSQSAEAQTQFKQEQGFFGSVKSFYFRTGIFEDALLIGPSVGYRLDKQSDISLHIELLNSTVELISPVSSNPELTTAMVNVGLTYGRIFNLSPKLKNRSEVSVYQTLARSVENYASQNIPEPGLTSATLLSRVYLETSLSERITAYPALGGFLGAGAFDAPVTEAELSRAYDGWVIGPSVGVDFSFRLGESWFLIARPTYTVSYALGDSDSETRFSLNLALNF